MSTAPRTFLTIAGRWKTHEAILADVSQRDRTIAMMMFYAGFAAALDACGEIAEFDENTGCQLLTALHRESDTTADKFADAAAAMQGPIQ